MESKFNGIAEFLKSNHGIDLSGYDSSFVEKTIERRLALCKGFIHVDYLNFLTNNAAEVHLLIDSLHNSFTESFRNPLTFSYLEQLVLPQLLASKSRKNEKNIRIWSAACASGAEPYSLAILLDELNESYPSKFNFRIFATDNNPTELNKAKEGIFNSSSMNKVTLKRVNHNFSREEESYILSPRLKELVDFSYFDLLSDTKSCPEPSIYGNFDLVMCSNLLFYYKPALRSKILDKVENTMAPGAFLVTGETERDILTKHNFHELYDHSAIFQKRRS